MKAHRDGDRLLQLLVLNEEFLVNAGHQLALTTSPPFVHTARRYYRLNDLVSIAEIACVGVTLRECLKRRKLDHLEEVKVVTRFP